MICKNEAAFIRAALQSAKPFITHWSVLDTGSTDGTQDIIREEMSGIPGVLTEGSWEGWDKSRTKSIELSKQSGCDFILLLDADETVSGSLCPITTDQVGWATVKYGSTMYKRPNMLSAKHSWHYVGVTHEYLTAPEKPEQVQMPLVIITNPERCNKTPEKCAEDARILEQGLLDEPNNTRYMFYLANSYKDSLQKEKAIEAYKRCFAAGGWEEERYISLLRIAQLSEGLKTFPEVCDAYKKANEFRPQRAGETLRNLARYCLWWANGTALPEGERLFIDESCYLPRVKKVVPMKVLVVIPTQGLRNQMLGESQFSVMKQTRQPDQVIITSDDISLADKVNKAVRESNCDCFVMLSDDDLLEPTFLEKTVGLMEQSGVDIVHTKYTRFGSESVVTGNSNHISVTSLFSKNIWSKTEGYVNCPYLDWDFNISCIEAGAKVKFIDEPLWKYRIHPGQDTQHETDADRERNRITVMSRHPKTYAVK